jgi:hypothetical protein
MNWMREKHEAVAAGKKGNRVKQTKRGEGERVRNVYWLGGGDA